MIAIETNIVSRLTSGRFYAVTLYPFILIDPLCTESVLRHELIHGAQAHELWVVGFYALYLYYWASGGFSYYAIPFEKEAYANQADPSYLNHRQRQAWRMYTS